MVLLKSLRWIVVSIGHLALQIAKVSWSTTANWVDGCQAVAIAALGWLAQTAAFVQILDDDIGTDIVAWIVSASLSEP